MVISIVAQSLSITQAFLLGCFVFLAFLLELQIFCLIFSFFFVVSRFIAFLELLFFGGLSFTFILDSLGTFEDLLNCIEDCLDLSDKDVNGFHRFLFFF